MAIGTPASLGSASASASATTIVLTVTAAAAVGDKLFVFAGCETAGTTVTVADSAGNTYTVDKSANATQNACSFVASAQCTSALTSGVSTITVTYSAARVQRLVAAAKVTGIATASPFDQSSSNSGNTPGVVSWSSNASGTTTQADELAWAVCCNNAVGTETQTAQGTPTMAELFDFANTAGVMLYVNWVVLSATQTVTGAGQMTDTGGRVWNGLVATYKGAAAAASSGRRSPLRYPGIRHPATFRQRLYVRPAPIPGVADVTVTLATPGDLALSAAAAAAQVSAAPTVGNLVLSAAAPTPSVATAPTVGALVLSAAAPAARLDVAPAAGPLVLGAAAPSASVSTAPTVGNLVLSAAAPATRLDTTPSAGVLTLGAAAPAGSIATVPTVGPLVLGAAAPVTQATVPPAAGNLVLSAAAPTIVTAGNITVSPSVGDLVLGAAAPQTELRTVPAVGAITLTGAAAAFTITAQPSAGNLVLGAGTPTLVGGSAPAPKPVEDIAPIYVTL